jgi:holo-[acyl-carrier protein] synthase
MGSPMQHIGIDIIEIYRVEQAIARWGENFLQRIYTDAELELYQNKPASLAARFAGKEAVIKVLDITGGINWKDIEILANHNRKPSVRLHGKLHDHAIELGLEDVSISLSHSRDYAIAMATTNNSE